MNVLESLIAVSTVNAEKMPDVIVKADILAARASSKYRAHLWLQKRLKSLTSRTEKYNGSRRTRSETLGFEFTIAQ